ncbi:hypothetical protein NQ095_15630 [Rossellomorea sp. SC111]|uniref:hypothetical protein n=1 Tax=Rossellomorea sp. SC111 TaxID=2968985 RepID=UPI00215A4552|nr:hypothetical protein [Rossellomorea sp. SC111]MCR8849849.1 hypothetical protein [Rossellomorea sp. SC111]
MIHIALDEWKMYVRDEMEEDKRIEYEEHLYSCEHCMGHYLEAVDAVQRDLPSIEGPSLYTDEVMERIPFEGGDARKPSRKDWYEKKVFHYVLATAMTLILMATGIFGELLKVTSEFEKNSQPSFTENILNKTTALLDDVEKVEEQEAE